MKWGFIFGYILYEWSYLIDITNMAWKKLIWKAYICIMDHFIVYTSVAYYRVNGDDI